MLNDNIIGKVKHLFYRFEFQGVGALANKTHDHCGVILQVEPVDVTVGRICCDNVVFYISVYGADYDTMHNLACLRVRQTL